MIKVLLFINGSTFTDLWGKIPWNKGLSSISILLSYHPASAIFKNCSNIKPPKKIYRECFWGGVGEAGWEFSFVPPNGSHRAVSHSPVAAFDLVPQGPGWLCGCAHSGRNLQSQPIGPLFGSYNLLKSHGMYSVPLFL